MNSRSDPRRDEDAVSEVVGFLLTFAIIAAILVVSMLAFNEAQERAEGRVVEIQVDSIAQRVAGVVVETGLFVESQGGAPTTVSILIELPNDLQGNGYSVVMEGGGITVTSSKGEATQSVFGVGGEFGLILCGTPSTPYANSQYKQASGGNLYVVYDSSAAVAADRCLGLSNSPVS